MRYLGVDYGRRRIGLALSDATAMLARPWQTIGAGGTPSASARAVDAALTGFLAGTGEDAIAGVVVGLPRRLGGEDNEQTPLVRQFVEAAVGHFDKKIEWRGTGVKETGLVDGRVVVVVNPEYFRPNDVNYLSANPAKAREELGWTPETSFDRMVEIMVDAELERLKSLRNA